MNTIQSELRSRETKKFHQLNSYYICRQVLLASFLTAAAITTSISSSAADAPKRLLVVSATASFRHPSV